MWGRSAGGHLALLLGVSGDEPALEGDLGPYVGTSSRVAGVVNFFGVADLSASLGAPSDGDRAKLDAPAARLLGGPLRENREKVRAASPVTHVTPDDPPVLTVHGTTDRVVPYDQAVRLDAALRAAGVPSFFVTIEGAGHGDFGAAADDRVAAFLARTLLGEPVEVPTAPIEWRPRP